MCGVVDYDWMQAIILVDNQLFIYDIDFIYINIFKKKLLLIRYFISSFNT
jgi:hypothetical protein